MENISRRSFLQAAGAAAATPVIAAKAASRSASAQHALAYTFFNPAEASFIEAAVARLIPADEAGPGALEANVPYFIDRQLASAWGAGERLYRGGPFQDGTPSQGYQAPFTPAELFRKAIRAVNDELTKRGTRFADLAANEQDAYLKALQAEKRDLGGVSSPTFFESLLEVTIEGFFSDPAYGGNKDMIGWQMVGFPGAYADFYELVDQYNVPYTRKPISLAENGRGEIHLHAGPAAQPRKGR